MFSTGQHAKVCNVLKYFKKNKHSGRIQNQLVQISAKNLTGIDMIQAIPIPYEGRLSVRFDIPDGGKIIHEYRTAVNIHDCKRQLYFRIRKYIIDTLTSWLEHRHRAISPFPDAHQYAERLAAIELLLLQVAYHKKTPPAKICELVCRQLEKIRMIAPSEKSRHYKYFKTSVLPILEFCINSKGATA